MRPSTNDVVHHGQHLISEGYYIENLFYTIALSKFSCSNVDTGVQNVTNKSAK